MLDVVDFTVPAVEMRYCHVYRYNSVQWVFCLSSTWLYFTILIAWVRPEPSLVYCFDNCTLYTIWVCAMDWFVHMLTYLITT
jgi:hypothetical protein